MLRGKVDVYIRVKDFSPDTKVDVDLQAAKNYAEALKKIAEISSPGCEIPLSLIASQEGVLSVRQNCDADMYRSFIEPVFADALEEFCAGRKREGENLKKDILFQLASLESCASVFKQAVPEAEAFFKNLIVSRFNELLGDKADEQRIMSETAAMLVKYTINEEIVRLESHLEALKNEMRTSAAPGKKIDFLCQEINREINTIGSKSQFADVSAQVIAAKDALENIREQARNIE